MDAASKPLAGTYSAFSSYQFAVVRSRVYDSAAFIGSKGNHEAPLQLLQSSKERRRTSIASQQSGQTGSKASGTPAGSESQYAGLAVSVAEGPLMNAFLVGVWYTALELHVTAVHARFYSAKCLSCSLLKQTIVLPWIQRLKLYSRPIQEYQMLEQQFHLECTIK